MCTQRQLDGYSKAHRAGSKASVRRNVYVHSERFLYAELSSRRQLLSPYRALRRSNAPELRELACRQKPATQLRSRVELHKLSSAGRSNASYELYDCFNFVAHHVIYLSGASTSLKHSLMSSQAVTVLLLGSAKQSRPACRRS